jgi:hypothetical protein
MVHFLIEDWAQLIPIGIAGSARVQFVHKISLSITGALAKFRTDEIFGGKVRARIKPTHQDSAVAEDGCFAREIGKDVLDNIPCPVDIPQLSIGGAINQRDMPADQLSEGFLGALLNVKT